MGNNCSNVNTLESDEYDREDQLGNISQKVELEGRDHVLEGLCTHGADGLCKYRQ